MKTQIEYVKKMLHQLHAWPAMACVWVFVLLAMMLCAVQANALIQAWNGGNAVQEASALFSTIKADRVVMNVEEYKKIAEKLKGAYPTAKVEAVNDGVEIKVDKIENFEEFREVIKDVMAAVPGAKWDTVRMCAGSSCGTPAYSIVIRAYNVQIKVSRS